LALAKKCHKIKTLYLNFDLYFIIPFLALLNNLPRLEISL